ncbi:hypothetical protein EVJ58_g4003 [Rhodofomes roseus]|uniref:Aldehyde dehydrogenase domain-containing protein n=1 Tax=Rhodofomes roseus TaxID=34475 RepID=A0A4Y9YML3_9APHY|nr:hypothetical protein EVJ58_g4003 [Rhodofomes roseus]
MSANTHTAFKTNRAFSAKSSAQARTPPLSLARFPAWEKTPPTARAAIVLKAADLSASAEYTEKLAAALKAELVAPDFVLARDPKGSVASAREYATAIVQLKSEPPSRVPGRSASVVVQRRAMGVIISKSDAPVRVAEVNAHPVVQKINFPGGLRVGRAIALEMARHNQAMRPRARREVRGRRTFSSRTDSPGSELTTSEQVPSGGRGPRERSKAITHGTLLNSGQICMSSEHVIIQRSAASRLSQAIQRRFAELKADALGHALGSLFVEASGEHVL